MELVAPAGPVYQAGTLSGNPLAMTAGLWCLRQSEASTLQQLRGLTTQLAAGLADAAREARRAAAGQRVRIAAHAVLHEPSPCATTHRPSSADTEAYGRFFRAMLARGIYPPPSQFEAWFLSAAHSRRDIDKTIAAARSHSSTSHSQAS